MIDKTASILDGIFYSLTKESMGNMPFGPDSTDQAASGGIGIPGGASSSDVGGTMDGQSFGVTGNSDAFNMSTSL